MRKGISTTSPPVRREFLSDLHHRLLFQANEALEQAIRRGLRGESDAPRYGLPFFGDNQFLLNRLEEVARPWSDKRSPHSIRW